MLASAFFPFSIQIFNAGEALAEPSAPTGTGEGKILWNSCNVNSGAVAPCACMCATRHHPDRNGQYRRRPIRLATAPRLPARAFHAPARVCQGTYSLPPAPDRQTRGRQVRAHQWDEAFAEIGKRLRGAIDTYGNESVYLNYGTGALGSTMGKSWPPAQTAVARLMNLVGGYLNHYSDYSTCQITVACPICTEEAGWTATRSPIWKTANWPFFRQQSLGNPHVGLQGQNTPARPLHAQYAGHRH